MINFSKNFDIREVGAPVAAADDTDQNTDILDMSGYESVCFVVPVTDSVATGVATITAQQNTTNSDTGMAALSGAVATATCTTNDDLNNKLLVLDVVRPSERYVGAAVTSATANIAFGNTLAILYNGRTLPYSAHSTILQRTTAISPSES